MPNDLKATLLNMLCKGARMLSMQKRMKQTQIILGKWRFVHCILQNAYNILWKWHLLPENIQIESCPCTLTGLMQRIFFILDDGM